MPGCDFTRRDFLRYRAIITWYTGYTDTDDGFGRMKPAPADTGHRNHYRSVRP